MAGRIAGTAFGKVIEVGHSQGSVTTWEEAANYHDVAGVIITGMAHSAEFAQAVPQMHPALVDPAFAHTKGIDATYITSVPGRRESMFYNSSDSDPAVIAHDEATKNIWSAVLLGTDPVSLLPSVTRQIDAPVLVILGTKDAMFCGPLAGVPTNCSSGQDVATDEAPDYSSAAQLRACVVPGSGHDINLALNHDVEERQALAWSNEYVGQQGQPIDGSRILPPDCSS